MAAFNAINRGVYIADNLNFLRALNSECIDLACIDPPFAKNETFTGDRLRPKLSDLEKANEQRLLRMWGLSNKEEAAAAGLVWPDGDPALGRRNARGGYSDIWSWEDDIHEDWMLELEGRPHLSGIHKLIDATRYVHGDGVAAYLCYMAVRLIEIRRVLKPTGSLFLHCDLTANGYLRQLLDAIFGGDNLRNEIIWSYRTGGASQRSFSRKHETLFFYSKSAAYTFHPQKEKSYTRSRQRRPGIINYGGGRAEFFEDERGVFNYVNARDVWDLSYIGSTDPERTGYPTQKPYRLAERIIRAGTNPGDVVLDCFAGCAYVAVAAEIMRQADPDDARQWVACDFNLRSWTVFKRQFNKKELVLLTCNDETTGQQVMGSEPTVTLHGPKELPKRKSPVTDDWQTAAKLGQVKPAPNYKEKARDVFDDRQMRQHLLQMSGYLAWCCGFANRRPDGSVIETTDNFHLDHIRPKSKGGSDRIYNRAPMCLRHNTSKGNREISLERLRTEIAAQGELQAPLADLIDLDWAYDRAMEIWAIEFAGQHAPAAG